MKFPTFLLAAMLPFIAIAAEDEESGPAEPSGQMLSPDAGLGLGGGGSLGPDPNLNIGLEGGPSVITNIPDAPQGLPLNSPPLDIEAGPDDFLPDQLGPLEECPILGADGECLDN